MTTTASPDTFDRNDSPDRSGTLDDPLFERPWTGREVCLFLSCSERSLRYLVASESGFPRPVRVGKSPRWSPRAIRVWVENGGAFDDVVGEDAEKVPVVTRGRRLVT